MASPFVARTSRFKDSLKREADGVPRGRVLYIVLPYATEDLRLEVRRTRAVLHQPLYMSAGKIGTTRGDSERMVISSICLRSAKRGIEKCEPQESDRFTVDLYSTCNDLAQGSLKDRSPLSDPEVRSRNGICSPGLTGQVKRCSPPKDFRHSNFLKPFTISSHYQSFKRRETAVKKYLIEWGGVVPDMVYKAER